MIRASVGACAAALVLALAAGCGGDDEKSTTAAQTAPQTATGTEKTDTATETTETTGTSVSGPGTSPESQPGGAGDEEPARSQALFTGRGGSVKPKLVRVPAYISIRVELRSADGKKYALHFPGRTLKVDGDVGSASASFSGLRPGKALIGEPVGGGGNVVRVEATAEPGP